MNQILAAFIFFTRLPFWKIKSVPDECFKHVVSYWSFSGWLTGGIMAICFWGISQILPVQIAVIAALTVRLLITGALEHCMKTDLPTSSTALEAEETGRALSGL